MNLENSKKIKVFFGSDKLLRFFLALVFLSAGVYRVYYPDLAVQEFINLKLPTWLSPLMIVFEIGAGLGLLINRYAKLIYYSLLVFLVFILTWAFIINGKMIISQAGELFVFNLNPTDWFLHFIFLFLTIIMLARKNELKK